LNLVLGLHQQAIKFYEQLRGIYADNALPIAVYNAMLWSSVKAGDIHLATQIAATLVDESLISHESVTAIFSVILGTTKFVQDARGKSFRALLVKLEHWRELEQSKHWIKLQTSQKHKVRQ